MNSIKAIMILLALIVFWLLILLFSGHARAAESPDNLVERMATGFVQLIKREIPKGRWYDCGVPTPRDQWQERASAMARHVLLAAEEYNLKESPWIAWAIMFKESRGNRCAIGPIPRERARELGLAPEKSHRKWSESEVQSIVQSPRWRGRPVDLGLGQVVWKRYARIPDGTSVRVPTLDEMLSLEDGARVLVFGMQLRSRTTKYRKLASRPHLFWRGSVPSYGYASEISSLSRAMGGPRL